MSLLVKYIMNTLLRFQINEITNLGYAKSYNIYALHRINHSGGKTGYLYRGHCEILVVWPTSNVVVCDPYPRSVTYMYTPKSIRY